MRARTPLLVVALAGAVLLTPAAPASAANGDAPVIVGAGRTLKVDGNGWGHGHGMSQWGAQGAALQDKGYAEILAFYYPGTQLATVASGRIKVLITGDADNNLKVKAVPGLKLVDTGRGKTYRLPTSRHPRAWKLKAVAGATRVYFKTGRWHRYRPDGHAVLAGDGQFRSSSHRVTLKLPGGVQREYRGALRFSQQDTVNVLGMEKYLRGVVPAEVFTSWRPAALQAQAVAARSYAAFERDANLARYFHVYDTTRSQAYSGVSRENPNTDAAIAATAGRMVTFGGKVAFTQFSASSGGWTSTGSQPYLRAQPDVYDTPASGDTNLGWTKTVGVDAIEKAFPAIGTLTSVAITERDNGGSGANEGWVLSIALTGTTGNATLTGAEFRSLYGLKSAYFTLSPP